MATRYCDANLTTGANDGSSWENAFRGSSAIATAFSMSASGDTIMVAAGDYANSGFRTNNSLSIVAVDGPYKTTMRITGNPPGGFWFFQSDNRGGVGAITIDGFRYASSLSNFTMFYGAAVLVRNCIFSGLSQKCLGSYVTFVNCLVSGCTFSSGIFDWRPNAYNCTFIGNTGPFGNPLNVANCVFSGNSNNNVAVKGQCAYTFASSVPSGSTGCIIGTDAKTDADGKLIAGSPCICAGSSSYLQSESDILGVKWSNPPSIGCYEYVYVPKPLPPYARRVEYLESTGTQYIDTGYAPTATTRVEMAGLFSPGRDPAVFIRFGSRYSATQSCFAFNSNGTDGNLRFDLGTSSTAAACQWQAGADTATRVVIDANTKYAAYVTDTGTLVEHTFTSNMTFADALPLAVFAFEANPLSTVAWQMRVSSLKIWNNGTPVRSFVPCRILDTGYLWDEVEGKFYGNSGTGDFVLGPDVREGVVPTRLNPFGVGRRQEEIRRVEYLESTGTQWIDTGIYPNQTNTSFDLDISFHGDFKPSSSLSPQQATTVLRADDTTANRYEFNFGGNQSQSQELFTWFRTNTINDQNYNHVVIDRLSRQHITYDAGSFAAGDTAWTTPYGSADLQGHLRLLGAYSSTTGEYKSFGCYNARIYGFRVWQSDILVRDFVPVAIGPVGYLLDKVSGQLFGNDGSGDFVVGPDTYSGVSMVFDNYVSENYGSTIGPLNGTKRFTVPFSTPDGWAGYALEGSAAPQSMQDVMSLELVICDPNTGGSLVMLWNYGTEHGSFSGLDTAQLSYSAFGTETGTVSVSPVPAG